MTRHVIVPGTDPVLAAFAEAATGHPAARLGEAIEALRHASDGTEILLNAASRHASTIARTHGERVRGSLESLRDVTLSLQGEGRQDLATAFAEYLRDAAERWSPTPRQSSCAR